VESGKWSPSPSPRQTEKAVVKRFSDSLRALLCERES
jgi:hypothetical protein